MSAIFEQRKQLVTEKVKQLIELGNQLFNTKLPMPTVQFNLHGRCAGMAIRKGNHYYLRFNAEMMTNNSWDHIYNDTVPHETAHGFCQFNPRLGKDHNAGWADVCRKLGGTGERCHSEPVIYARGNTYEYITSHGHRVRISDYYHNYVQDRKGYLTYRKGMGYINSDSIFTIVGRNGQGLSQCVDNTPVPESKLPNNTQPTSDTLQSNLVIKPGAGESKASISRRIMLEYHNSGKTYEETIAAMITACGYNRQLARATYRANALKVGVPAF